MNSFGIYVGRFQSGPAGRWADTNPGPGSGFVPPIPTPDGSIYVPPDVELTANLIYVVV